ncbi:Protein of unknown function, DUF488 [Mucilaginibacter pineti]|uniref:DUF488 domain-containing protein n=1 Tax=Mucilaginibacter pineti TaxID=1391627 RepID=A0A1G7L4R0_9SPHI|nr:DUF488 domain-containing protein [Mucilaginibacter pineti]SDF44532.1 Protein of unknown function, DUF488 [Mucilaginibacter pineti]
MDFFTIGVFNTIEQVFFNKLIDNNIDTFCDIRQRRAVRGAKYAFVNSTRLQDKLRTLGIKYVYVKELAPTAEIRSIQKAIDQKKNELKTQRQELGEAFASSYNGLILDKFDFQQLFAHFQALGSQRVVLFCVEEKAKACHRSLVASKLLQLYNQDAIKDL